MEVQPVQPIRNLPQPVAQMVLTLLTDGNVNMQGPDVSTKEGKAVVVQILIKMLAHVSMLETKPLILGADAMPNLRLLKNGK